MMRKRIYWLLPDVQSALDTMDDLLLGYVELRRMHFLAREGTDMNDLPVATVLQTSDVARAVQVGLIVGAVVGGLIGALVAVHYPIVGDEPQWGIAAALAVVGALFGVWTSSMIGVSIPSKRLERFRTEIENGKVLLMVDANLWQAQAIEERLHKLHPEAHLEGSEPHVPAFP
jgi:hypothetical protein